MSAAPSISVFQPGVVLEAGRLLGRTGWAYGRWSYRVPSGPTYATQTLSSSREARTSSLVTASSLHPLSHTAWRSITASSQPVRRRRPVFVPNSTPRSTRRSPMVSPSGSSEGNGLLPTRVTYAFATPMTRSIARGPTPAPVHTPPAIGFDEVTNG